MKRLIFVFLLIAGSLVATTSNAQVYIGGRIGFVFHPHRVYCPPPPPIVYQDQYSVAPSYYNNYDNGRVIITAPEYGYGNYKERGYEREEYREHHDRDDRRYRDDHGFRDDRSYRDNEEHRGDRREYRSEEGHRRD